MNNDLLSQSLLVITEFKVSPVFNDKVCGHVICELDEPSVTTSPDRCKHMSLNKIENIFHIDT